MLSVLQEQIGLSYVGVRADQRDFLAMMDVD